MQSSLVSIMVSTSDQITPKREKYLSMGCGRRGLLCLLLPCFLGNFLLYIALQTYLTRPRDVDWNENGIRDDWEATTTYIATECVITSGLGKSALERLHFHSAHDPQQLEVCSGMIKESVCALASAFGNGSNADPVSMVRVCVTGAPDEAGIKLGCYVDFPLGDRLLGGSSFRMSGGNSVGKCVDTCFSLGMPIAGLQNGTICHCGEVSADQFSVEHDHQKVDGSICNINCPRNSGTDNMFCGGTNHTMVYSTGIGVRPYISLPEVEQQISAQRDNEKTIPTVKVVFLLQLNGRAVRQVLRLLNAIYHPKHYYYIHIDARQSLLFEELSRALEALTVHKNYPGNIFITKNRLATLWGGANLLTMYLNCINEIENELRHWNYDYIINMSESDFPIMPIGYLEDLLRRFSPRSFLKSHGGQPGSFIGKQGLNFVFVQCANRMWRVGERTSMPKNVFFDGGSDWIVVHRKLARLAVGHSDLAVGLRLMYENVLLPLESFFHTLAYNSELCDEVVNANLKYTHWIRSRGCHCQYKHIVDWCGCSPSVITSADLSANGRISQSFAVARHLYSARKFDPMIDNDALMVAEMRAFNVTESPYNSDGNLQSYWMNIHRWLDGKNVLMDTILPDFVNKRVLRGELMNFKVLPSSGNLFVYKNRTEQVPLLIYQCEVQSDNQSQWFRFGKVPKIEVLLRRETEQAGSSSICEKCRKFGLELLGADVGLNYDRKEQIFRHYSGFITIGSQPVVRLIWRLSPTESATNDVRFTVAWRPPGAEKSVRYIDEISVLKVDSWNEHQPAVFANFTEFSGTVELYHWRTMELIYSLPFPVFPSDLGANTVESLQNFNTFYRFLAWCHVNLMSDYGGDCHRVRWSTLSPDQKAQIQPEILLGR